MMERLELGLGIDLGTTNSAIAYGQVTKEGGVVTNILEVDRISESGCVESKKTLPSVVYYKMNNKGDIQIIVGDFARKTYGKRFGYVIKSVKSSMGIDKNLGLNAEIEDKTAQEVSARIIQTILASTKKKLNLKSDIKDVIITVPASYGAEQNKAVLEAAKLAGIDEDENKHDILLCEPKAVIFNIMNMLEQNKIPSTVLDLNESKNVLVFDLGGGTLDCTIHKVSYDNEMPIVEDIAISRYTQIGGDDFDELITLSLLNRFEEQSEIKVPQNRKDEAMCVLRKLAEKLKMDTSSYYENLSITNEEVDEEYEFEVSAMSVFDDISYDDYITVGEVQDMIKSLMAEHLNIGDVNKIDSFKREEDIENIVYPILDTLAKAKSYNPNLSIDAIVLNGGMTRFYPIKERVEKFFGIQAISVSNPDLAVAEGASYYHYCLHKYNIKKSIAEDILGDKHKNEEVTSMFKSNRVLNDAISIGLNGQYISKVVEAGRELPCKVEVNNKFILAKDSNEFILEVFGGRGIDKNQPNRKLGAKVVAFEKMYEKGTVVNLDIRIDNNSCIYIYVNVNGGEEKLLVSIDKEELNLKKAKGIAKLEVIENKKLNVLAEMNLLKSLSSQLKTRVDKNSLYKSINRINEVIERILGASNKNEFCSVLLKEVKTAGLNEFYRGYLYNIAFGMSEEWSEKSVRAIKAECERHFRLELRGMTTKDYILEEAKNFINKWSNL